MKGGSPMKGSEVVEKVRMERTQDKQFIKWWRREEDWLDYDLIDRFLQNASPDEEIGGYELVGMDDIWERVVNLTGTSRLHRESHGGTDVVVWKRKADSKEPEKVYTCIYAPDSLIKILDVETRGNLID